MGNVFANGNEIAGKAMGNKVIAAMPNVCMSPPSPPAGPIPIPYPCFGQASDTDNGTKKVTIEGKPACIKSSSFKKSKGDEACTKSFGMGVVTHSQSGSIEHAAYSFDVKFEGKNVCRHMDLVGGNHGSPTQNSADTGMDAGGMKPGVTEEPDCEALQTAVDDMREASDAANTAEGPALKEASTLSQTSLSKYGRDVWKGIKKQIEDRCWSRHWGALTASQMPGGPVQGWASNQLNREACQQRGVSVENQAPVTDNNSKVCGGGEPYEEEEGKYHTEAQALEALPWGTNAMPASITFATSYRHSDPSRKDRPCRESCQKKIEEACECGLTVFVCIGNKAEDQCKK